MKKAKSETRSKTDESNEATPEKENEAVSAVGTASKMQSFDVLLTVTPDVWHFNPDGGTSTHQLTNAGKKRLAIKAKCSNNRIYRMKPACSFLDAGEKSTFTVTRLKGPARLDKIVLHYLACSADDKDAKKVFAECGKVVFDSVRISLRMTGESYPDEPKNQIPDAKSAIENVKSTLNAK